MKFDERYHKFLAGDKFSVYAEFPMYDQSDVAMGNINRVAYLSNIVAGKNVLHVGCCDHIDVIKEKRGNGTWLHDVLCQNANRCAGIDINAETIAFLQNDMNVEEVYALDITAHLDAQNIDSTHDLRSVEWDYIILGELLEHIGDPVSFLKGIHRNFHANAKEIIITVPNAYHEKNLFSLFKNVENINTDHRFWFTPFTLSKIVTDAGFKPIELRYVWGTLPHRPLFNIFRMYYRTYPQARSSLVLHARFN